MTEAEQTSLPEPVADPDATLVTPRFGEAEAQTARPVVPLASAARRRRRVWPLLVISALLGGAETRPRLVEVIRGGDGAARQQDEQPLHVERPRAAPAPQPARPLRRNVDRIRDILEGAPPPE